MSEASGRAEMERRLIEKSLQDGSFRQRLVEDPKGAMEEELGTRLPEEVRVVTVEETRGHHLPRASRHPDVGRREHGAFG